VNKITWKSAMHASVSGTQNVVSLCVEMGIPRLVFCSTSEVTLSPYLGGIHSLIINQTECKALPPSCDKERQLLLPGYPASKLRAENLVLAANGRPLADGKIWLHTFYVGSSLSIRVGIAQSV
jgi:nucleoside-diphosphate-sugar epimerase